jgi:hypothetical protein
MSEYADDDRDSKPTRLIYEMREHVQRVRNRVWDAGVDGELSVENKRLLAKAAIKYWDVLYEFREATVLSKDDFPDISPVRSRIGKTTQVSAPSPRRGDAENFKPAPAVDELPQDYLIELTEDLDDLARKLGFGASERDATPHDDIGHDDLAALLEARGQDEALDKVPGDV